MRALPLPMTLAILNTRTRVRQVSIRRMTRAHALCRSLALLKVVRPRTLAPHLLTMMLSARHSRMLLSPLARSGRVSEAAARGRRAPLVAVMTSRKP